MCSWTSATAPARTRCGVRHGGCAAAAPLPADVLARPDDPYPVSWLLDSLRKAGAEQQAAALADRTARVSLDDPLAVDMLLDSGSPQPGLWRSPN